MNYSLTSRTEPPTSSVETGSRLVDAEGGEKNDNEPADMHALRDAPHASSGVRDGGSAVREAGSPLEGVEGTADGFGRHANDPTWGEYTKLVEDYRAETAKAELAGAAEPQEDRAERMSQLGKDLRAIRQRYLDGGGETFSAEEIRAQIKGYEEEYRELVALRAERDSLRAKLAGNLIEVSDLCLTALDREVARRQLKSPHDLTLGRDTVAEDLLLRAINRVEADRKRPR